MKSILMLLFATTLLSSINSIFAEVQQNTTKIDDFVFVPRHYDIETRVILSKDGDPVGKPGTAPGKLVIFGKPRSPTQILEFEASQLVVVNPASVTVKNVSVTSVCMIRDKWGNPSFQVKLGRILNPNEELEVRFEYITRIIGAVSFGDNDAIAVLESGLVVQHYVTEDYKKIPYAVTVIGSNNAHNVFPTGDQNAEVTYKLRVIRQANYTTVANAELENSIEDPNHKGWMIDTFAVSNKSKIETAFFAVSDLAFAESRVANTTAIVRVHAPPQLVRRCREPQAFVDAASKAIEFYSDYFNQTPQSLDIFPSFPSTEYIPPRILLNSLESLLFFEAHFGKPCHDSNKTHTTPGSMTLLVLETWIKQTNSDLDWELHSFLEDVGRKALEPKYDERPVLSSIFRKQFDEWSNTWSNPEENRDETSQSEPKGFEVTLKMLEATLGQSVFRRGVPLYLLSSNKNLTGFCEAMDQAAGKFHPNVDMCELVKDYTYQSRPVVTISAVNATHVQFRLRQLENATIRNVPTFTLTENGTRNHVWLTKQQPKVELTHDTRKWIIAEANSSLHYRTLYDDKLFELIQAQLRRNHSKFDWLTRATFFADYFGLIRKDTRNDTSVVNIFKLLPYLEHETDPNVWWAIHSYLEQLEILLGSHPNFTVYKNSMVQNLDALWSTRGIDTLEKRDDYTFPNSKLIKWACSLGSKKCLAFAKKLFEDFKSNPENSLPELDSVLCSIGASGGRPAFDFFWERFENKSGDIRDGSWMLDTLTPLSCATEADIIDEMLEKVVEKAVKNETSINVMSTLLDATARNPAANERLLQFLSKNLDRLSKGIGNPYENDWIWNVPYYLSRRLSFPEQLQQMKDFLKDLGSKFEFNESRNLEDQSYLQTLERGVAWMRTTGEDIINLMKLQRKL